MSKKPVGNSQFDFSKEIEPTEWLVKDLIPLGQLIICLARSGHGKSYFSEDLAVKIVYEKQFLGKETMAGDVLIIDQDTPTQSIEKRLTTFGRRNGDKPLHNLFLRTHEGLSFSDGTVYNVINEYPDIKLAIIDTYHSVLGTFNPNTTVDANYALTQLKSRCVCKNKTVWVNHHLSEKEFVDYTDLMFGDTLGKAMGNSAIIQRADSVFVLCGVIEGNELKEMYIRPWGKRAFIPQKPFLASFDSNEFKYIGILQKSEDECIGDLRVMFAEHPEEGYTVQKAHDITGHKHGIRKIYNTLAAMERIGEARMERGKSNQFQYFSTKQGQQDNVMVKYWTVMKNG